MRVSGTLSVGTRRLVDERRKIPCRTEWALNGASHGVGYPHWSMGWPHTAGSAHSFTSCSPSWLVLPPYIRLINK